MGVVYKLRDEVVHFIISQRQSNPLASCRQLAESASAKFNLRLSKSSVHDVLKESGITTPRGRKPKDKFEIPQEKKKQIQSSLSQIKLIALPVQIEQVKKITENSASIEEPKISLIADVVKEEVRFSQEEASAEYEGVGRIFFKAALWDLGIFSEEGIKESDWEYYLTYAKGVRVALENNKSFFIDLPLPLERCIREVVDGLVNNTKPFVADNISGENIFKACMAAEIGHKINTISIVDEKDHVLLELNNIVELNRNFLMENRYFVVNKEKNVEKRAKALFFSQAIDSINVIEEIAVLKGFNALNKNENVVTILIDDTYGNKTALQEAAEKLNRMYLRDEEDRLVSVHIKF